jgi:hypothetical protein
MMVVAPILIKIKSEFSNTNFQKIKAEGISNLGLSTDDICESN